MYRKEREGKRRRNGDNMRNLTHCAQGHPFDEANTKIRKTKYGEGRVCIACAREADKRSKAKMKERRQASRAPVVPTQLSLALTA